jgi:uncharacterized membrane protein
LVARFARAMHGDPAHVARYCRSVTIAWTIFSAALRALFSLYVGGYLAAWSVLANILRRCWSGRCS